MPDKRQGYSYSTESEYDFGKKELGRAMEYNKNFAGMLSQGQKEYTESISRKFRK